MATSTSDLRSLIGTIEDLADNEVESGFPSDPEGNSVSFERATTGDTSVEFVITEIELAGK